jgi:hypothetical protein
VTKCPGKNKIIINANFSNNKKEKQSITPNEKFIQS